MIEPRPELARVPACPHGVVGGAELAALGLTPSDVIDFSASTNPLGPSPAVLAALAAADAGHYPDDGASALRESLASRIGLPVDRILVGNGSAEIIWLLALAYLRAGDHALVVGPTFGEYARACRVMGVEPDEIRAEPAAGFAVPLATIADYLATERPRLAFLCNPNNPTGSYLSRDEVAGLAAASPGTLLVLDEAYRSFVAEPWRSEPLVAAGSPLPRGERCEEIEPNSSPRSANVALLRSLTKDHALAGLRLGYVAAAPEVVEALAKVRPPWSVNAFAQAAGLAALADDSHLAASRAEVFAAKADLVAGLESLGLAVTSGAANFILVAVGDARAFRSALLRRGLCVRDCSSFGLPAHARIGVRTRPECRRLLSAIDGLLSERPEFRAASAT